MKKEKKVKFPKAFKRKLDNFKFILKANGPKKKKKAEPKNRKENK